jgi:hypothetical protein
MSEQNILEWNYFSVNCNLPYHTEKKLGMTLRQHKPKNSRFSQTIYFCCHLRKLLEETKTSKTAKNAKIIFVSLSRN